MPNADTPDLTLFLDIVHTLERIGAPYMIIGGFAATMYGITRTTFDIDIVVDLKETHIQALAAVHGEWPLQSDERWDAARLSALADRLAARGGSDIG